jgi:hypothetical protein
VDVILNALIAAQLDLANGTSDDSDEGDDSGEDDDSDEEEEETEGESAGGEVGLTMTELTIDLINRHESAKWIVDVRYDLYHPESPYNIGLGADRIVSSAEHSLRNRIAESLDNTLWTGRAHERPKVHEWKKRMIIDDAIVRATDTVLTFLMKQGDLAFLLIPHEQQK